MTAPVALPPRVTLFEGPACHRCLTLSLGDHVWPEMVMPLPQEHAPLARDGSGPCCFDCASADSLWRAVLSPQYAQITDASWRDETWFVMARVAVGNDRLESMRLPLVPRGLIYFGVMAPSDHGDLEKHSAWLDSLGFFTQGSDL